MARALTVAVVQADELLAAIVGAEPIKRTEVTIRIWDYIREHQRQDPADRRVIVADDTLRPVFDGRDRVTMFELQTCLSGHLRQVGTVPQ